MLAQASKTAVLVAAYRGRATVAANALCDDPFAARLAGDEGLALAAHFDTLLPHMELWIALRTAELDAHVRAAQEAGVPQVVLLGAGLDTRAARLARNGVRYFEVDHPASLADRNRRLASLPDYPEAPSTQVACDFEQGDFVERLRTAGFDAARPAVIVWEGVSYYLSESAVRATLRRVAEDCHPQSAILFDLFGKKLVQSDASAGSVPTPGAGLAALGEPLRWGSNDVLPLCYELGYRWVRVTSFDELALRRTGTYVRERAWRFQSIAEARVVGPA